MNASSNLRKSRDLVKLLSERDREIHISIMTKKWADDILFGLKLDETIFPKLIEEFPRSKFYLITDQEDLKYLYTSSHILFIGDRFFPNMLDSDEFDIENYRLKGRFDPGISFSMYGIKFSMFGIRSIIDKRSDGNFPRN